jgi:flagellar FliL protein
MADEAAAPAGGDEIKKRSPVALILGVLGLVLVTAAVSVGATYVLVGGGENAAAAGEPGAAGADGEGAGEASIPDLMPSSEVVSLGSFTVNLRDSAGGRLLQMELSVEGSGDTASQVEDREAQLRDAILMLASDYSFLELEGTEGRIRLRDEIHRRINVVLTPAKVDRVYFTSFVVQ